MNQFEVFGCGSSLMKYMNTVFELTPNIYKKIKKKLTHVEIEFGMISLVQKFQF